MCKIWCFIFLCLCGKFELQAQQNKRTIKLFQEAKEVFRRGENDKALQLLGKALELDKKNSDLYLLQADIFNKKGERNREIKAIELAYALDSLKGHPYYYFVLAENHFNRANYEIALDFYTHYLRRDSRKKMGQQAVQQIKNCEFALDALKNQIKRPAEIYYRAEQNVYWPALDISGKTLLFTEQNKDNEKMWMLRDSVRYPLNFNVDENHGSPSLTADGQMMYFSMKTRHRGFDIYVARRVNDTVWSEPVNLGSTVNTDAWDTQPAISADGTKLYFASTREGGRGGSDIWFSRLLMHESNGRQIWSEPRCLYFNTPGDEMAPFIYFDNKTLFFASNAYPGMGRKDIYKVDVNEVTKPLNIGITVNSQNDEFGFIVDASGKWGYFSSDISGKRCIYRYQLQEDVACPPATFLSLSIENAAKYPILPDFLSFVDIASGDTLAHYDGVSAHDEILACIPMNQLILVNVVKRGYLYYSDTLQLKDVKQKDKIRLQAIQKNQSLVLKGVFFDVDDYKLKPESDTELRQLVEFMRLNPSVNIEIVGHTDNTGSDEHNTRLSENRAFEVFKYLFQQRIKKERMSYEGYGRNKPLSPNDTEEGRAINRRTEITIK